MSKHVPEQPKGSKKGAKQSAKKLLKRERHLRQRLEEDQAHYEQALARLQHAEARLQKRQERVERLNVRLALLQQQMPPSTIALSEPAFNADTSVDTSLVETIVEEPEAVNAKLESPPSDEGLYLAEDESKQSGDVPEGIAISSVPVEHTRATSFVDEMPVVASLEPEPLSDMIYEHEAALPPANLAAPLSIEEEPVSAIISPAAHQASVHMTEEMQAVPEPVSNSLQSTLMSEARAVAEAASQFVRVAAIRTKYLLDHLDQMLDEHLLLQELEQLRSETSALSSLARAVRKTIEMLLSTQTRPEAFTSLTQEVERQQQVLTMLRMNTDFPLEGLMLAASDADAIAVVDEPVSLVDSNEDELGLYDEEIVFDLPSTLYNHSLPGWEAEEEPSNEAPDLVRSQTSPFSLAAIQKVVGTRESGTMAAQEDSALPSSSSVNAAQASRLDEDEKEVETVAAMVVADAAAAAAAEAEALAEASSLQTRNAYVAAKQADLVLEQIRTAVDRGALSGAEARSALYIAERSATEAYTALADAEAAEAQAVSAAINAEAEAEVAEGMAFSVHDRAEGFAAPLSASSLHSQLSDQTNKHVLVSDAELNLAKNRLAADEEEMQASILPYQELA